MANILIIDDDKDVLDMIAYVLQRAGHSPITALSGRNGLDIIKTNPPHLIIVDIMMPGMNGYDFTRRVRTLPGQANLPILIYSARTQPADKQAALEAGATSHMAKNTPPAEMIQRINDLLGNHRE